VCAGSSSRKSLASPSHRPFNRFCLSRSFCKRFSCQARAFRMKIRPAPTSHAHRRRGGENRNCVELPRANPRYVPLRGSPAIGQAVSAVHGITSLVTAAPQADGARGYRVALMYGGDLPNSECRETKRGASREHCDLRKITSRSEAAPAEEANLAGSQRRVM